ncbi:MAG: hypothetical protein M1828_001956 [Chrysothrix sp. TS-e1954]|nr:MAG: hypothetical protein M1828_001956 [Chrysothrix sp. TS-e1954]
MPLRVAGAVKASSRNWYRVGQHRGLLTLAIETSCDDTSIAILERHPPSVEHAKGLQIHHHEKITSNSLAHKGINTIVALESHQENCADLVNAALRALPKVVTSREDAGDAIVVNENGCDIAVRKPDVVCATRGPGMRANLHIGHEFAKGLSVAWQRPFIGVHHMHAHALTPRLVSALDQSPNVPVEPAFPFLTLLVSGGHTDLIHTKSLFDHNRLASTSDNAVGNAMDRVAREVLPHEVLGAAKTVSYGPILESFAFPRGEEDHVYFPPKTRADELQRRESAWGWSLPVPLSDSKRMEYSFAGIIATVSTIMAARGSRMGQDERVELAREAMRVCFEHLAIRLHLALEHMRLFDAESASKLDTLVVSGGVAANKYLKHVLRVFLDSRGHTHIKLVFPPLHLCTDNAVMIGWTGMEVFEAGYQSRLSCMALREWSLDSTAKDGGILGVPGWRRTGT